MKLQKEASEAIYQQADPEYGKYEGTETSSK